MAGRFQRLAIVAALFATLFGYLLQMPDVEGMEQVNIVRVLSAIGKLNNLVGQIAEKTGISDRIRVARSLELVLKVLKDPKENEGVEIVDTLIEKVPVRIARPANNKQTLPALVYYHGGAFYLGSTNTHNAITSALSRLANIVVISVDYRLAPENPFPAGLDDCYTVTKYVLEKGDSKLLNIDRSRVALAGDSAGGNFAAVIAERFANNPLAQFNPRTQVLIYPALQLFDFMLPSYMKSYVRIVHYKIDQVLTSYLSKDIDSSIYGNNHTSVEQKKKFRKYVDWSLIPAEFRTVYKQPIGDDREGDATLIENAALALTPEISPLLVSDQKLSKLPPTYILSVGHDPLRDESFIYAGRLKKNGVPVVHHHFPNTFHAAVNFLHGPLKLDIAETMINDIVEFLKEKL